MILAEAHLTLGADHPVRKAPVSLARGDLEATRQDRSRQRHDNKVVHREVPRPADDAADSSTDFADIDLAEPNRLLEVGELLDLQHTSDHERTVQARPDLLDGLDLEPCAD